MKHVLFRARIVALTVAVALLAAVLVAPAPVAQAETVPSTSTATSWALSVYNLINKERAAHGLAPYKNYPALITVAKNHNTYMARNNMLTHQCPGELSLGARFTAAGYTPWKAIGENIGMSTAWSLSAALGVHTKMYNEIAPNDPHRRNILNTTFGSVGVHILIDVGHHRLWMTEDFGKKL